MDKNAWSLVAFTLLAQAGAGTCFLYGLLAVMYPSIWGNDAGSLYRKVQVLVLLLLFSAVFLSFFHLGYPRHFFHALNNLGQSWLSREIFALLLLGSLVLFTVLRAWEVIAFPGRNALTIAGMAASLFLLFAMSRLYQLETIPPWQHVHTPLAFFTAAFLTGSALLLLSSVLHDFPLQWIRVLCITGLLLASFSLANHLLWTQAVSTGTRLPVWAVLTGIAGAAVFLSLCIQPGWSAFRFHGLPLIPVLAVVISVAGEVIYRWHFFRAFVRLGV